MATDEANPADLYDEERSAIASAVESRRREFAAGRMLARRLLGSLGLEGPLRRTPEGPPAWPGGVLGSIAHCSTLAAAAVCRTDDCAGLGIDLEPRAPLPPDIADLVLTSPQERSLAAEDPDGGLRVFCAKEAFYKAVYPLIRRIVDFDAVDVSSVSPDGFLVQLRIEAGPLRPGDLLSGRWAVSSSHVAAALVVPG